MVSLTNSAEKDYRVLQLVNPSSHTLTIFGVPLSPILMFLIRSCIHYNTWQLFTTVLPHLNFSTHCQCCINARRWVLFSFRRCVREERHTYLKWTISEAVATFYITLTIHLIITWASLLGGKSRSRHIGTQCNGEVVCIFSQYACNSYTIFFDITSSKEVTFGEAINKYTSYNNLLHMYLHLSFYPFISTQLVKRFDFEV